MWVDPRRARVCSIDSRIHREPDPAMSSPPRLHGIEAKFSAVTINHSSISAYVGADVTAVNNLCGNDATICSGVGASAVIVVIILFFTFLVQKVFRRVLVGLNTSTLLSNLC